MEEHYELKYPVEPEIVGVRDGMSQAVVFEQGFENKTYYKEFMRVFADPNHYSHDEAMGATLKLECVKLKKRALVTDFLRFSPMSYVLVSRKVYDIFGRYNLGSHRFFDARLVDATGKAIDNYFFFYIRPLDWNVIDFPGTEFKKGNAYDGYEQVSVTSLEEFLKDRFAFRVDRLALKNKVQKLDVFEVLLPLNTIITEPVYQELYSANVTGVQFRKIEVV